MLQHSFCHLNGVGSKTERRLWASGLCSWSDLLAAPRPPLPERLWASAREELRESQRRLDAVDLGWFAERLPAAEHWRLATAAPRLAYIDIETTGVSRDTSHITTIALYDGVQVRTYVHGRDLERFADDIGAYPLLVSYNGRCFDVPVIEQELRLRLPRAHVDLRFVLQSVGLRGGLKACERQLGLDREELEGIDGAFAVTLWHEYERSRDPAALETLLAYNVADVLGLEPLLHHAVGLKLEGTPAAGSFAPPPRPTPPNPHRADLGLVARLRDQLAWRGYGVWPS